MFNLFKKNSENSDALQYESEQTTELIQEVQPAVKQALILICEKCGNKISQDETENPSRLIQKSLKAEAQELFGKKVVRPVLTSCLDNCPKEKITVGIVSLNRSQSPRFFEVDVKDQEAVRKQILEFIGTNLIDYDK